MTSDQRDITRDRHDHTGVCDVTSSYKEVTSSHSRTPQARTNVTSIRTEQKPRPSLDGEISRRITDAGLWDDPAWQAWADWNHHIYTRAKD